MIGVELDTYFDLKSVDGSITIPRSELPRGAELVLKAPNALGEGSGADVHDTVVVEMTMISLKKPFGISFEESEGRPLVVGVHSRQAQDAKVPLHSVLMKVKVRFGRLFHIS